MALMAVARDGDAVLVADGDVGATITPTGYLVALVDSILAQGDWQPYDGAMPDVPEAARDKIAAMKRDRQP